jgi:hypothetical protein
MTSASRWLLGVVAAGLLGVAGQAATASPLKVALPCDRPVLLAGGDALQAAGRTGPANRPFSARLQGFLQRACGGAAVVTALAPEGRLGAAFEPLQAALQARRPGVALIDFPTDDVASGMSVEALLERYATLLSACDGTATVCVIGGQRPADALGDAHAARQLELERRASARFGARYLPTYAHFQSESRGRRAMPALVAGEEQRYLSDAGHELLFNLYRLRLLELTAAQH